MAFSHINAEIVGVAPGRNDPCPCASGRKVKSCCGVDRWRLLPLRGRRRGRVPADLAERVDQLACDWNVRFLAAKFLPARLGGLAPGALTEAEREELIELYGGPGEELRAAVARALEVLEQAGYGKLGERRPRAARAHGSRRTERLQGVCGKLPRALAKRLPTSADTHRAGLNHGEDVYGRVRCASTLRAAHLGLLAAAGGIWHGRGGEQETFAATTAGELAQLLTGRQRLGGKDIADVHRLLAELEGLAELHAGVNPPRGGGPPRREYEIPGPPIERVERRLPDGRWVGQAEYAGALDALSDAQMLQLAEDEVEADAGAEAATIRIHLADWVRQQLAHGRPTLIDFAVWAHLRPVGQRLYAWLQASHRDEYDGAIEFYLGAPLRYTLGLRGRQSRAAASVRAALAQLYGADLRYWQAEKWSVRGRWATTNLPAFRIAPRRRPSAPTPRVRERRKCPGERPRAVRGLTLQQARAQTELVRATLTSAGGPPAAPVERTSAASPRQRSGP
jgi:hypothetical protein